MEKIHQAYQKIKTPKSIERILELFDAGTNITSVPHVASLLKISPNTLLNHCTKELGMTSQQYLMKLRLDRVKKDLIKNSCKLENIARQHGFSSSSYLNKCFQKMEGITPHRWRIQMRNLKD